jgi:hypothetical protein
VCQVNAMARRSARFPAVSRVFPGACEPGYGNAVDNNTGSGGKISRIFNALARPERGFKPVPTAFQPGSNAVSRCQRWNLGKPPERGPRRGSRGSEAARNSSLPASCRGHRSPGRLGTGACRTARCRPEDRRGKCVLQASRRHAFDFFSTSPPAHEGERTEVRAPGRDKSGQDARAPNEKGADLEVRAPGLTDRTSPSGTRGTGRTCAACRRHPACGGCCSSPAAP